MIESGHQATTAMHLFFARFYSDCNKAPSIKMYTILVSQFEMYMCMRIVVFKQQPSSSRRSS